MDKQIQKKYWTTKKLLVIAGTLGLITLLSFAFAFSTKKTVRVQKDKLMISSVIEANFQDVIIQTGSVEPLNTVFVNSLQGGVVEKIYVEDGTVVEEGTPILKLNNPNAQMAYLSQQTSIVQNISQLRNIKLQLETKTRELKENLIDLDYKLDKTESQFKIDTNLYKHGAISKLDYDNSIREYKLNKSKKNLLKETMTMEEKNRSSQLSELNLSIDNLEKQLALLRENLPLKLLLLDVYLHLTLPLGKIITVANCWVK
jgi:HlyD family secretion protein